MRDTTHHNFTKAELNEMWSKGREAFALSFEIDTASTGDKYRIGSVVDAVEHAPGGDRRVKVMCFPFFQYRVMEVLSENGE